MLPETITNSKQYKPQGLGTTLGFQLIIPIVSQVTLLIMLALQLGAHYFLENPLSSCLHWHPRLRIVLEVLQCFECHTWLGCFGASSPKPLKLYSDDAWVLQLRRSPGFLIPDGLHWA